MLGVKLESLEGVTVVILKLFSQLYQRQRRNVSRHLTLQ